MSIFRPKWKHIWQSIKANIRWSIPILRARSVNYQRISCTKEDPNQHISRFVTFFNILGAERIRDASVLEVGPGTNLAMAGLFIGAGADRYVAIDRFPGGVFEPESVSYCQSILQAAPETIRQGLANRALTPSQYPWNDRKRKPITVHKISLEQASKHTPPFDILISHNVIEHVYDIYRAFSSMRKLLVPGGVMVHRIDYGPHSIWREYKNPLTFLAVNTWLWRMMGLGRAVVNRYRHNEIIEAMRNAGFSCETVAADRLPETYVKEVRPFLPPSQKNILDGDLAVSAAWIVAR